MTGDDTTTPLPQAAPPDRPRLSDKGQDRLAERRHREAEALRANLRRRKDQRRARDPDTGDMPD
jgi:hypothetical protein